MLFAIMLSLLTVPCDADGPAHIQSQYGQLVTSSTLTWVRSGIGLPLAEGAVSSGTGDGVICRGLVAGILVAGFTSRARCLVPGTSGKLITLTQYSVLQHVPSASKLRWKTYDKYSPINIGAVAGLDSGNTVFIGRRLDSGIMRTAFLEVGSAKTGGFGRIAVYSVDDKVELVQQCDLLVEEEPVTYQLEIFKYEKKPKVSKDETILASSSMFRFEEGLNSVARMTKMVYYNYEKSLYFGHIKGVIRGFPTKIKLPTGETRTLVWGQTEYDKQSESIMVEFNMHRNTAVDVEVLAERVEEEQSWSGVMVAVFADGSKRQRNVEGVTITTFLDRIRPRYSNPHRIKQQQEGETENLLGERKFVNTTHPLLPVDIQQDKIYSFTPQSEHSSNSRTITFSLKSFVLLLQTMTTYL